MSLQEYSTTAKALASLVPWSTLRTPSVMQLKDRSLLATIRFRGPDLDSSLASSLVAQAAKLNHCFKRFKSGWGLWSEARRHEVREYPDVQWPDPWSQAVYEERRALFTTPGQHYVTDTFLSLAYQLPSQQTQWWQRWLYTNLPTGQESQAAHQAYFLEECQRTVGLLKDCCPEAHLLEGDEFLSYLHSTVNPTPHPVRMPAVTTHMDSYLAHAHDLSGGIYPQLGPWYLRCVSLMDYPEESHPGICDTLNTLPVEYRACVRYLPMDRAEASKEIGTYRHSHHGQRQDVRSQLKAKTGKQQEEPLTRHSADEYQEEAAQFQNEVDHGRISAGYLTTTVVVWDTTLDGSQQKGEAVAEALNTAGFMAQLEDAHPLFKFNTLEAWRGTLPGERRANVRQPLMHSMNLAHLVPATSPWRGHAWNPHLDGTCLLQGISKGQTPVRVNLHHGDVAHTGVIGSTGDGKSTWLNFACLAYRQYAEAQARVRVFDKGHAAYALTHLLGGLWYDLGVTPLQPFAALDRPYEIGWAVEWLDGLLTAERLQVKPSMKKEAFHALTELATWDRGKRTMSALMGLVEHRRMKEALSLYTYDGPYGQIFDGEGTALTPHPWRCFEMGTILETPAILNAQLPVLFHQLEQEMTGLPEVWALHEAWLALDTPYWAQRLRGWLKGFRVRNGAVILATQSLADAVDSPIMPALMDNVVNWICTPNDKALEDQTGQYYQAIGLNLRQRELLRDGTKKRDYYLIQPEGQTMLDFKLGPIALAACRTPDKKELPEIERHLATDPDGFATWYTGRTL